MKKKEGTTSSNRKGKRKMRIRKINKKRQGERIEKWERVGENRLQFPTQQEMLQFFPFTRHIRLYTTGPYLPSENNKVDPGLFPFPGFIDSWKCHNL